MCTGLEIAALAATAAGSGVSAYAQHDALRQKDRATAQAIANQGKFQQEANAKVGENIKSLQDSNQNAATDTASKTQEYLQAVKNRAQAGDPTGIDEVGGASSRYQQDVGNAKAAAVKGTAAQAANEAGIASPAYTRLLESQKANDLQSQLGLINRNSRGQQNVDQTRISSITEDPTLSGIGSFLKAAGAAAGANGGGPPDAPVGGAGVVPPGAYGPGSVSGTGLPFSYTMVPGKPRGLPGLPNLPGPFGG